MRTLLILLVGVIGFLLPTSNLAAISTVELDNIYQNLITAIGDKSSPFPQLRRVATTAVVAGYSKRSNSIVLEEKAIQVCEGFGAQKEDAIAFLLAHELTHFYQKHAWEEANFGFLMTEERFQQDVAIEREADTYGAFLLHLARYKINIIPKIIPALYEAYGLIGQNLAGYPSLQERQAVANEVCKQVADLIHIFETANYLFATGQLGQAAMSYDYLLNFVQCKELYANLGAACIAAATAATTKRAERTYIYPVSVDANFPIRDASDFELEELIQKAIQSLEKAVSYDPSYYPAFINLACAYELADEDQKATQLLRQLEAFVQQPDQIAEMNILSGILTANQGKDKAANDFFDLAAKSKANTSIRDLARKNKKILQGKAYKIQVNTNRSLAENVSMDGIDLKYEPELQFDASTTLRTTSTSTYQLAWKQLKNSTLSLYQGSKKWALLQTTKAIPQTQAGIKVGSNIGQIKTAYGEPDRYLLRSDGYTMVYFGKKLLFTLNAAEKVIEWGTFAIY